MVHQVLAISYPRRKALQQHLGFVQQTIFLAWAFVNPATKQFSLLGGQSTIQHARHVLQVDKQPCHEWHVQL